MPDDDDDDDDYKTSFIAFLQGSVKYHKGTSPMSADDFVDDVHLVTGGAGFTGFKLGQKLADIGKKVILVDIVPPKWPLASNMSFVQVFKIY